MSKQKLVGYKIKKPLKTGDMVSDIRACYTEVYEPVEPVDELAGYAHAYAHMVNDYELNDKIVELVKQIKQN